MYIILSGRKSMKTYTLLLFTFYLLTPLLLVGCGKGESGDASFSVVSTDPSDGLGSISVSQKINVTFNLPANEATINKRNIVLQNVGLSKPVDVNIIYDSEKRTASINAGKLGYESTYKLRVNDTVLSETGEQLKDELEISFFTEFKPPLSIQEPENGKTGVNTRAVVRASFDKPLSPSTINGDSFYLIDNLGTPISGAVSFNKDTAVLTPATGLNLNTRYTAVLTTNILDSTGTAISANDISWTFTTTAIQTSTIQIGTSVDDEVNHLTLDSQNNMIIAGYTKGSLDTQPNAGKGDAFIAKYDANHTQIWSRQFGTQNFDSSTHVTVDELNNVYVLGYTDGSLDNVTVAMKSDIFIQKYDTSGTLQWTNQFGSIDEHEMAHGIKVVNNKLYVTGSTRGTFAGQASLGLHDYFIAEHDIQTGTQNWITQSGTDGDDHVAGLTVDAIGNIIVAITSTIESDEKNFFFEPQTKVSLFAYSTATTTPTISWQAELSSDSLNYRAQTLVSFENNIYIAGERHPHFDPTVPPSPSTFEDAGAYVAKFDSLTNGALIWDKSFSQNTGNTESISIDSTENIYLGGFQFGPPRFFPGASPIDEEIKISITKFDNTATELWSSNIEATNHASISSITLDNQGNLHLVGNTHGNVEGNSNVGEQDIFMAKLNSLTGGSL